MFIDDKQREQNQINPFGRHASSLRLELGETLKENIRLDYVKG